MVNSLANMVVVVDESTPGEQTFVSLEEKLKEIGKRFAKKIVFVEI